MVLKGTVLMWDRKIRRRELTSAASPPSVWPSHRQSLPYTANAHCGFLTRGKSSGMFIQMWPWSKKSETVASKYQDPIHVCKWWAAFKSISDRLSEAATQLSPDTCPPPRALIQSLNNLIHVPSTARSRKQRRIRRSRWTWVENMYRMAFAAEHTGRHSEEDI